MGNFARKLVRVVAGVIPKGAHHYVYTVLLKPAPLRGLTNKILLSILPKSVVLPEGVVVLNPNCPIISGSLALGVYEVFESKVFREAVRDGMTVVDIGANIGYYTVISARLAGPRGKVLAFEPDPENFKILTETIKANAFNNVSLRALAIGDRAGEITLYKSGTNSGDHRITPFKESTETVQTKIVTLDSFVKSAGVSKVDIIKMDIQGAEGRALAGMIETLRAPGRTLVFTEFWPDGLKAAGTEPLAFLDKFRELNYLVNEIDEKTQSVRRVDDFNKLIKSLPGVKYSNLLCEKQG